MANRQEILQRLDIAGLLKELLPDGKFSGANKLVARCLWPERHRNNDSSPSFIAFLSDGKFRCQACEETGSIYDLYGKVHGLDYGGVVKELAYRVGLEPSGQKKRVTGFYVYLDAKGTTLYWKERVEPGCSGRSKDFYFFHGSGVEPGTAFNLQAEKKKEYFGRGPVKVLYQLPNVLAGRVIIFTEGEKQADLLHEWGLVATTLDSGSQSTLSPDMIEQLANKHIVILPDNDEPGWQYAERIAKALSATASSIKVVGLPGLPEKGDILDWVKKPGNDKSKLLEIIEKHDEWKTKLPKRPVTLNEEIETSVDRIMPEGLRAFPNLYLEVANLLHDPRRHYFAYGLTPLYDSLVLHIAAAPGARFPKLARAVANVLQTDEDTANNLLETALRHKMLVLDGEGNLMHPMVTAQFGKALKKCHMNAVSGALGGKAKTPEKKKKKKT